MNKIYLIIAICALITGAYFYGANLSDAKCRMKNLQNALTETEQNQKQLNQEQRIINETVYKTGVADIRRVLCDKYTIAE